MYLIYIETNEIKNYKRNDIKLNFDLKQNLPFCYVNT